MKANRRVVRPRPMRPTTDPIRLFERRRAALPPMPESERAQELARIAGELGVNPEQARAIGGMP